MKSSFRIIKSFIVVLLGLLANSCVESEIQETLKSIDENTMRANELSSPAFTKDTAKADYTFKPDQVSIDKTNPDLLEVMESAK